MLLFFFSFFSGVGYLLGGLKEFTNKTAKNVIAQWNFYYDYYWGIGVSLVAGGITIIFAEQNNAGWAIILLGTGALAIGAWNRGKAEQFKEDMEQIKETH
jgi:hypothetical protein